MFLRSESMWGRAHVFCALLAVACISCTELGASALDAATTIDIGTNEIGASPAEFELPPLRHGKQGSWTVVRDATAKTGIAIEQSGVQATEEKDEEIHIGRAEPVADEITSLSDLTLDPLE